MTAGAAQTDKSADRAGVGCTVAFGIVCILVLVACVGAVRAVYLRSQPEPPWDEATTFAVTQPDRAVPAAEQESSRDRDQLDDRDLYDVIRDRVERRVRDRAAELRLSPEQVVCEGALAGRRGSLECAVQHQGLEMVYTVTISDVRGPDGAGFFTWQQDDTTDAVIVTQEAVNEAAWRYLLTEGRSDGEARCDLVPAPELVPVDEVAKVQCYRQGSRRIDSTVHSLKYLPRLGFYFEG